MPLAAYRERRSRLQIEEMILQELRARPGGKSAGMVVVHPGVDGAWSIHWVGDAGRIILLPAAEPILAAVAQRYEIA